MSKNDCNNNNNSPVLTAEETPTLKQNRNASVSIGCYRIRHNTEGIRLCLVYCGVAFHEINFHVSNQADGWIDTWKQRLAMRRKGGETDWKLGSLPYLVDNSQPDAKMRVSGLTNALRHIARKPECKRLTAGLSIKDHARVDEVLLLLASVRASLDSFFSTPKRDILISFPLLLKQCQAYVQLLSAMLGESKFIAGQHLCIADFEMYDLLYTMRLMKGNILGVMLKQYMRMFEQVPELKRYMGSEKYLRTAITTPQCVWGFHEDAAAIEAHTASMFEALDANNMGPEVAAREQKREIEEAKKRAVLHDTFMSSKTADSK
jgi:hypothetical protein